MGMSERARKRFEKRITKAFLKRVCKHKFEVIKEYPKLARCKKCGCISTVEFAFYEREGV